MPAVGDAREDWRIVRGLSEILGKKLPYDTIDQLRKRMADVAPHMGHVDHIESPLWLNGEYFKVFIIIFAASYGIRGTHCIPFQTLRFVMESFEKDRPCLPYSVLETSHQDILVLHMLSCSKNTPPFSPILSATKLRCRNTHAILDFDTLRLTQI